MSAADARLELARSRRLTRRELAAFDEPRPVCLCVRVELALGCGCAGRPVANDTEADHADAGSERRQDGPFPGQQRTDRPSTKGA